jgi:hypothetical protein
MESTMADHDEPAKTPGDLMHHHAFEVGDALDAHADWKRELRDAVVRGYCEQGSEEAGRDDQCPLGRWLHSLEAEGGADRSWEDVAEAHARFHCEASAVVEFLELGRIDDARAAMEADSAFARASEELVSLLEAWSAAA